MPPQIAVRAIESLHIVLMLSGEVWDAIGGGGGLHHGAPTVMNGAVDILKGLPMTAPVFDELG